MTNPAYEATNSDVEKVEKKKYPSDNYLNEILTNTEFAAVVPIEAVRCMARELVLLRTFHPNGMMQLSNELAEMKRKCVELPDEFARIGENLRTQDNRITSHPVFVVFQKEEMVVSEEFDHDRIAWVWECGDGEVEDRTARRLEALHKGCRDTRGYSRYAMKSINRFVTAFFTEDGCKDYLRQNGHNLNEPFIYVHSAYRNDEWRVIRNWLMKVGTVEGSE